jgi:predicted RNA binding protein YcfA (HicA-like mRNA interferase family)
MSTKLSVVSGAVLVRALQAAGCVKHSQVGSHVKLTRGMAHVSIPLHDPVKRSSKRIARIVEMARLCRISFS